MTMKGETRFSTATIEASLTAGMLEPIELSLEAVNLAALFILNICNQSRQLTINKKECQLSGLYIEASTQISGGKAVEALTLPKPQVCLCPSKGTSFTLT